MPTFLHSRFQTAALRKAQAHAVAKALDESTGSQHLDDGKKATMKLPGDVFALRGIPCVGVHGGIGGAIRGTRPGDGLE